MRFHLVYEGELKPSQLDPLTGNPDKLAEHKQSIRKQLHKQMRQQWATDPFLKVHQVYPRDFGVSRSPADQDTDPGEWSAHKQPLAEAVAQMHCEFGYRFVPLVKEDWRLRCALSILLLRRDHPGSLVSAGDLDNRLKTLIDGLRKPKSALELGPYTTPDADEDPFYCLLEEDSLITELSVQADTLLDEPTSIKNQRWVRAIITVTLQPYDVTMFNLAFA